MRKYESIAGIHKVSNKFFNKGDIIHVSEKMDGANASFECIEGVVHFYSRNTELLEGETLRGFVPWIKSKLSGVPILEGLIFYGEWMVKHKIQYTEDIHNTFMLFDIYDKLGERYFSQSTVAYFAELFDLKTPKCLYYGEYISLEDLRKYVGVSDITERGEGIVIKNEYQGTKTKWVREDFQETKVTKQPKKQNLELMALLESVLTSARVEKFIHKGLDEGVYESLDTKNYGSIMKYLSYSVVEDMINEEGGMIENELRDEFIKVSKKRIPAMARELLKTL